MKTQKQLSDILLECYREAYRIATPSADFDELIRTGEAKQDQFYNHYKLSEKRQQNILEKIFKKYRLTKYEKRKISEAFYMGCSPMFE